MITITPVSSPANSPVSVRSVPAVNGTVRSRPTLAPSASAAISGTNRATSIAMPPVIV